MVSIIFQPETTCSCAILGYRACNCGSTIFFDVPRLTANQQARAKAALRPCNRPTPRRNHAPTR